MMKTCEALRQRMFALAGCDWAGEVCFKEGEELSLLMDGERHRIFRRQRGDCFWRRAPFGTAGTFLSCIRRGISHPAA